MRSKMSGQVSRSSVVNQSAVVRRLAWYWQVEAANVVIVPAAMVLLSKAQLGFPAVLAIVPMSALLVAGATYLRAKFRQLATGMPIDRALSGLAAAQFPLLAGVLIAVGTMAWAWLDLGITRGRAERWVVTVSAILAGFEYVNYYHRQLQHFDNANDWQRLISGTGFRKSQLRRDLERAGLRKASASNR